MDREDLGMCFPDEPFAAGASTTAGPADTSPLGGAAGTPFIPVSSGAGPAATPFAGMYDGPIDITAYDETDKYINLGGKLLPGPKVGFQDMHGMVEGVVKRAGDRPLGKLDIEDHGYSGVQMLGADKLRLAQIATDPQMRADLDALRDHFDPKAGELDLGGCEVATGEEGDALLRYLARDLRVPVRAGIPYQNGLPGFEGSVETCYPPKPIPGNPSLEAQECDMDAHPTMDRFWEWLYD